MLCLSQPAGRQVFFGLFLAACLSATAIGGAALGQQATQATVAQEPIAILTYHSFDQPPSDTTTVKLRSFKRQLEWLTAHHYKVVPLRALVDSLRGTGPKLATPAVAITDDDGDQSFYTRVFPILLKERIPVTLFIFPSTISQSGSLSWRELKTILASGLVDVQSHTYSHPYFHKERARRSPKNYRAFVNDELTRARSSLESRLGIKVDMLAWPYGVLDPTLEAAAKRAGYIAAFGNDGGLAEPGGDLFAVPRIAMSDAVQGARFRALLMSRKPR
ncbi:MAG: polysaccharide deacetylase family protein [Methylovirgula sp.]